jgi:hypothetical protein
MTRQIALSGVALAVLMLAAAPAQAQLLNLGGDGGSTVSLNLGGSGGNSLLGLGGSGSTTGTVDVNGQRVIDIDGDGVGDLIDLDGDGVGDQEINIDLFGPGDNGDTQLRVGTSGASDEDVLVTLFGSGSGAQTANVNVLPGGTGSIFGGTGGDRTDADATLALFGPGTGGPGVFGGTDPTETGSTDGGGDGTGVFGPGPATGPQPLPPRPGSATATTRVAAAGSANIGGQVCFRPSEEQIAFLLSRGTYTASVTAGWDAAAEVSLVPVNLCPDARAQLEARIDGDANIEFMQSAVATNDEISAELNPEFSADDVLAVDQSGDELTVYVY